MIIKIKRKILNQLGYLFLASLVLVAAFIGVSFVTDNAMGVNVTNTTVIARVNITNTEPTFNLVRIDSPLDAQGNIDLTANTFTNVICNGSFQDINGFDTIKNVTATLYDISVGSAASDDNNTHYTNYSCLPCTVVAGTNNQNGTCLCRFAVQYFANPATWQCNMSINDSGGIFRSQNSTFYTLNEVLGISIESSILDYGNLSVSQISAFARDNVTNGGNIPINITVRGFGGGIEEVGNNVTMICEAGTNITFGNQRYYFHNNTNFGDMLNLTNQSIQVINVTIPQRTTDSGLGNSSNATFWRLEVPIGASGVCNGTIIFGAIDATLS
ncbi:hypothetical protein HYY70_07040 [Candidatus Woesearchaeota archaeon]|nr:hypothetical protein [Candidatus Woesearchaeota archaeon]